VFVFANFLQAIVAALNVVVEILCWLIIIRALLSWVSPDPYNPLVQFIERSTEWVLGPFRRLVPSYRIGIDLSPIFALLFFQFFVKMFLLRTLYQYSLTLQG
jgi:YggT family protein